MAVRLSKVAREFNVGLSTIVDFLQEKGIKISSDPNAKLTDDQYSLVAKEFSTDSEAKRESNRVDLKNSRLKKETITIDNMNNGTEERAPEFISIKDEIKLENKIKVVDHIDLNKLNKPKPEEKIEEKEEKQVEEKKEEKKEENPVKPKVEDVPVQVEKNVEKPKEREETPTPITKTPKVIIKQPRGENRQETTPGNEESSNTGRQSQEVSYKSPTPAIKDVKVVGTIDLDAINQRTRPPKKSKQEREIDEEVLTQIADMTGGKYFRATDNKKLEQIYQEIDKLEKSKVEVKHFSRKNEQYFYFALIGALLLILEALGRYTLLRKIP